MYIYTKYVSFALAPCNADLESIRQRLDGAVLHYISSKMLHGDLCLMCRNAMVYNDQGTEVYR